MKILLPPSEGKGFGLVEKPLDLSSLGFTELTASREKVLQSLLKTSKSRAALTTLGLTVGLRNELAHNLEIFTAKTAPAIKIYEGVVYQNIDYASMSKPAQMRFDESALIVSAAFGLLRPRDLIPHYRLSGSVTLPKVGVVSTYWAKQLSGQMPTEELIVDCRSGTYEKFWKATTDTNYVKIKVVQFDVAKGQKLAVSHFNKATKGLVTRALVSSRKKLTSSDDVANEIAKAGWEVELTHPAGIATLEVLMN